MPTAYSIETWVLKGPPWSPRQHFYCARCAAAGNSLVLVVADTAEVLGDTLQGLLVLGGSVPFMRVLGWTLASDSSPHLALEALVPTVRTLCQTQVSHGSGLVH